MHRDKYDVQLDDASW